jgi:DNA-binding LytR/AlgR family response regulator
MEVRIVMDDAVARPYLELHAPGPAGEAKALAARIAAALGTWDAEENGTPQNPQTSHFKRLIAWRGEEAVLLEPREISRFEAREQKVFAHTAQHELRMRQRLYELEEQLAGTPFVRISNSEIVNFDLVAGLDLSLAGTIVLKLKTGGRCYVSRRHMKRIKEHLGL